MVRFQTICTLGLVLLLAGGPLRAQMMNPHLSNAKAMEAELNYEGIPEELTSALAQPGNTAAELTEIYRLWGIAHLVLGDTEKARFGFLKLLTLTPDYQMPSVYNPRFRKAFGDIKAEFERLGKLSVTHTPPPAKITDPNMAPAKFQLVFRIQDKYERVASVELESTFTVKNKSGEPSTVLLELKSREGEISIFEGTLKNPAAAFPDDTFSHYLIAYTLKLRNSIELELTEEVSVAPVQIEVGTPNQDPPPAPVASTPTQPPPKEVFVEVPVAPEEGPGSVTPAPQTSNSMVITGIVVGTLLVIGGGVGAYFCLVEKACSSEAPPPDSTGRLDVVVIPEAP